MFNNFNTKFQTRHLSLLVYVSGFFLYALIQPIRTAENAGFFLVLHTLHALSGLFFLHCYSPHATPIVLAILFLTSRLSMLGMFPWLSDDVFGYLFYGKATLHGENLYAITADHPSLTYIRDAAYDLMAFKPHQNIYPPIATMFMTVSAWISTMLSSSLQHTVLIWKSLMLFCEGLGLWILFSTLRKRSLSYKPLLIYLAIPLTAIEGIGQAHNELLLLPFLAWMMRIAIDSTIRYRDILLGGLCGIIGMIKIYPIVLLIPIMITCMNHKQIFAAILSCTIVVILSSLPWFSGLFIGDKTALLGYATVLSFYNGTYFNGMVLYGFRWVLEGMHINEWWLIAPKAVSIVRALSIIGASILVKVRQHGVLYSMYVIMMITVFISPKVHAWYLIPIIFIGCVQFQRSLPILALMMMLTYAMYTTDPPRESILFEVVLWVIMGITLYLDNKGYLDIFDGNQGEVLA